MDSRTNLGGRRLFSLHEQHSKEQQSDSDQAHRIKRYPLDSEPAKRVCKVRAHHLAKNRGADGNRNANLGDRNNRTKNETDSDRPAEICPKGGGLHTPEAGSHVPFLPVARFW